MAKYPLAAATEQGILVCFGVLVVADIRNSALQLRLGASAVAKREYPASMAQGSAVLDSHPLTVTIVPKQLSVGRQDSFA